MGTEISCFSLKLAINCWWALCTTFQLEDREREGLVASEGGIWTWLISDAVFLLFAFQLRLIWPHSDSNEMLFHLKVQTRSQKRFHFDKRWNSLPRKLLAGVKFWRFHLIWGTRNSGESGSSVCKASGIEVSCWRCNSADVGSNLGCVLTYNIDHYLLVIMLRQLPVEWPMAIKRFTISW